MGFSRGLNRKRAAPACEYDGLRLSMMGTGVEAGCDPTRIDFELTAAGSKCSAIVKHEDVRPGGCVLR
jgi:hypothetical protein